MVATVHKQIESFMLQVLNMVSIDTWSNTLHSRRVKAIVSLSMHMCGTVHDILWHRVAANGCWLLTSVNVSVRRDIASACLWNGCLRSYLVAVAVL